MGKTGRRVDYAPDQEIIDQEAKKSEDKEKEIPRTTTPEEPVPPGKKERILIVFIVLARAVLRFFERALMRVRSRRLAKRMDKKH